MENIYKELKEQQNIRTNLSNLRQLIKEASNQQKLQKMVNEDVAFWCGFLQSEDAKTRKNAALLLGDIFCQAALEAIFDAYEKETTLFVKGAYLTALANLEVEDKLPRLKEKLVRLLSEEVAEENKKHIEEEIRALRKILIRYEGITTHTFSASGKELDVILLTNRNHREVVRRMITKGEAELHPLGVRVKTKEFSELLELRTYRDMVFPIHVKGLLKPEPFTLAAELWDSDLYQLLTELHKEDGPFYFRVDCKSGMTLEERSVFTKRLGSQLELLSGGRLVNSGSDYEIELRLIANKEGKFFPCLKMNTIKNKRFAYRKNFISASIHPSTAALMMELVSPYLKENAQIMDPFCGVGTMLIERDKKVPAKEIYGTDIFGEAIEKGRENATIAGTRVNYIHRDFFDFKHDYAFDEIVTNMPIRGKKTKEEMDQFYERFFQKSTDILAKDAIIIMYTGELGFVKKQLRLHKEYQLLQETCMQDKTGFYLLVIGYKRY